MISTMIFPSLLGREEHTAHKDRVVEHRCKQAAE